MSEAVIEICIKQLQALGCEMAVIDRAGNRYGNLLLAIDSIPVKSEEPLPDEVFPIPESTPPIYKKHGTRHKRPVTVAEQELVEKKVLAAVPAKSHTGRWDWRAYDFTIMRAMQKGDAIAFDVPLEVATGNFQSAISSAGAKEFGKGAILTSLIPGTRIVKVFRVF